jgi:integrase
MTDRKRRVGSVDKMSHGRYRVRVTLPDGTRATLSTHDTRDEALVTADAVGEVLAIEAPETGVTLAKFGEVVLTERELSKAVRDPDTDWSRWRTHISGDRIAKLPVKSVVRADVRDWLRRIEAKGLAEQTVKNVLQLLRTVLAEGIERGHAKENAAANLKVRKQVATEVPWTYLTPEEQRRLIMSAPDGMPRAVIAFAIGSGLRAGELCALRLADVHADHVVVRYGGPPAEPTKSGKIRSVPILPMARTALELARRSRDITALASATSKRRHGVATNPHGLAFPRDRGGYRDPAHILRWEDWQKIIGAAALGRDLRWHDLRHTCASSLVSGWWGRRWSLEEIQQVMGHASITTTERYAHLDGGALTAAAKETPGGGGSIGGGGGGAALASGRPALPQGGEIATLSEEFLNRRPRVRIAPSAPRKNKPISDREQVAAGRSLATRYLLAKVAGEETKATTLALEMAAAWLALDAADESDDVGESAEVSA